MERDDSKKDDLKVIFFDLVTIYFKLRIYTIKCGTNRLRLSVINVLVSRMPIPAAS
jgi:hypothetical protein